MPYLIRDDIIKPYPGIRWIHPLKQKKLEEFIKYVEDNYPCITCIIVFGSTVDGRCSSYSDIDLVIFGALGNHFYPLNNDNYDIVFGESVNKGCMLYKELEQEGVVIYHREDI